MPIEVIGIRPKLNLLRRYGPNKTKKALAEKFGVSVGAVESWSDGSAKRAQSRDRVPDRHFPTLIKLFQESLPGNPPEDEVRSLILGSIRGLEDAFSSGTAVLLADLMDEEGQTNTGRIVRSSRNNLGLVEYDDPAQPQENLPKVKLGERFSLVFSLGQKTGHVLVLQNTQQIWGVVRFGDGSPIKQAKASQLFVPGNNTARQPVLLHEDRDTGIHQFICLVSPEPFSASVMEAAKNQTVLDKTTLDDLARTYASMPKHRRAIHVLRLEVISGTK